jgi:steroid delta-isomerase-like uncharacterized protein
MSSNAESAVHALMALAAGEMDALERYYAHDFAFHPQLPGRPTGHAGLRDRALLLNSSLYDATLLVDFVLESGDKVVVRWRGRGVHKGDLLGVTPTGNAVEVSGISILRFEAGQIVEEWTEFDGLGLARQLINDDAVMPFPKPRPSRAQIALRINIAG